MNATVVITGAFGKSATRPLLGRGYEVSTLTNHPPGAPADDAERTNPFGDRVSVFPCNFDRPDELRRRLEGARVLKRKVPPLCSHALASVGMAGVKESEGI